MSVTLSHAALFTELAPTVSLPTPCSPLQARQQGSVLATRPQSGSTGMCQTRRNLWSTVLAQAAQQVHRCLPLQFTWAALG